MPNKHRQSLQFAALPWRLNAEGQRQVMLLTSRETRRWVIPKGWPIKRLKPYKVAQQEAYEEAGLIGTVLGKRPIGAYFYEKRLPSDHLLCEVRVYLLRVEQQLEDWPEKGQRETQWFDIEDAAARVEEGGLAEIILHAFDSGTLAPVKRRANKSATRPRYPSSRSLLGSRSP